MDYYQRIQQSIEYIEENLGSELGISEISSKAYFSPFHFQRLFQSISGYSVQEYIRKRRLTESAILLESSNQGVLEIAFACGYGSQEAFTRAFKTVYGLSPAKYRRTKPGICHLKKINFMDYKKRIQGDIFMNLPEIIQKEEINIIGYEYPTSLVKERYFSETAGFYEHFGNNEFYLKIPDRIAPAFAYGVPCSYKENGDFSFVVGEETGSNSFSNLEKGFIHIVIPEGKYAEFKVKGSLEQVQNTWRYIYGTWLPNSNYERAESPDYEVTDVCNSIKEYHIKIYIPLK